MTIKMIFRPTVFTRLGYISTMNIIKLDQFDEVFKNILESKERCLMLFTSAADAQGKYWCGDCEAISPLYETFKEEAKQGGLPFYTFIAGDRPTWKDPNHKFRVNKLLGLKGIPTMGVFDGKKLTRKLVEGELLQKEQRDLLYAKL